MVNMISSASRKVKEGKLVKVEIEYDSNIKKVKITGDFFMIPEEVVDKIEKSMLGLEKDVSMETIVERIETVAKAHNVLMIGIGTYSLAQVIREALN
ncbi:MAG TPA: hypothetical protein VIO11_04700 [Candidatus Methanoperedens sp.]